MYLVLNQNISILLKTIFCLSPFFLLTSAIYAQDVSVNEIVNAEKMYDLQFTDAKRDSMMNQLNYNLQLYRYLHTFNLPNSVPLPNWFDPVLPAMTFDTKQQPVNWKIPTGVVLPADTNKLAFYSIAQLSSLLKRRANHLRAVNPVLYKPAEKIWRYVALRDQPY